MEFSISLTLPDGSKTKPYECTEAFEELAKLTGVKMPTEPCNQEEAEQFVTEILSTSIGRQVFLDIQKRAEDKLHQLIENTITGG